MWLRTSCDITFDVSVPTPFILMLRPRSGAQQWVAYEDCTLTPNVPITEYADSYGNLCERLIAPPGEFSIRRSADVSTADGFDVSPGAPFDEVHTLPDEVLTYLLPSRCCESDRFIDFGRELVDGAEPGYDQVAKIVEWIRTSVRFNPGFQQLSNVGSRGQPAARGRMPRAHSFGHRVIPQSLYPGAYRCRLSTRTQADGFSCLVRGVRGWPLVHLRCNAGRSTWRASCRRLWARRGRRGDVQPVWPGAVSQRNGIAGRDARRWPEEQLRIHCKSPAKRGHISAAVYRVRSCAWVLRPWGPC